MTPRPYLSWSSMDQLERSEERWRAIYLRGEKTRTNRGMDFGKKMADGLEDGEATGNPLLDLMIENLPKLELMDQVIEDKEKGVEVDYFDNRKKEWTKKIVPAIRDRGRVIPILAKPDTMNEECSAFKEYKTSQEPWTQKRVDECGQLDFYATAAYLKNGRIPGGVELDNVLTAKQGSMAPDGKIGATGAILRFQRKVTMVQVLRMMSRMIRAWERMEKLTEELL